MKKGWIIVAAMLVLVIATFLALRPDPYQDPGPGGGKAFTPEERLEIMRLAIAETENLNPTEAIPLWQSLIEEDPQSLDSLQNLVVSRLTELTAAKSQLENSTLAADARDRLVASLPQKIKVATADASRLVEIATSAGDAKRISQATWLRGSLDAVAVDVLSGSDNDEAMRQMQDAATNVAEQLRESPGTPALVGLLDDMVVTTQDPIAGPSKELATIVAAALMPAADANPRNLLVALRAMDYAILAEDPAAADVIRKLKVQVVPFAGLVERRAGVAFDELADVVIAQIDQGQFSRARITAKQLENVLRGSAIYASDRQKIKPHPLDMLATNSFNLLSMEQATKSDIAPLDAELEFSPATKIAEVNGAIQFVTASDVTLDNRPELVVLTDDTLTILQREGEQWSVLSSTQVMQGIRGCVITDLFLADGDAPRILKKVFSGNDTGTEEEAARDSKRHKVFPSIAVFGEFGIEIVRFDGRESTPDTERLIIDEVDSGLTSLEKVIAVTPIDLDADGDLDLVSSGETQGVRLWINRDNMTFYEVSQFSQLPAASDPVVDFAIVDFDRDLAVDVITIQASGQVGWLKNLLHFQMQWSEMPAAESVGQGRSVSALEWDGNVSWDICYSGSEAFGLLKTETTSAGGLSALDWESLQFFESEESVAHRHSECIDLNNDGWYDLVSWGDAGVQVVRGQPQLKSEMELQSVVDSPVTSLTFAEIDSQNGLDMVIAEGNQIFVSMNVTADVGNYVDIQMAGIYDNATGRVNHYAIGSTHELRFGPHYRAAVVTERDTRFGIGSRESADTLRTIFTNGVTQNLINPQINEILIEDQTLKGSCPYLYAWDGSKFVFVTDCLWAAPLGLQFAMGQVVPDRPWEYLKVDGEYLQPKDGNYEIRLTEELWEIAYFDHVSLIAVDHPAHVDIWTNEKVGPPDVTQHQIFGFEHAEPVRSALDKDGNDCSDLLAEIDERYVQGFDARFVQGLCPTHWIDLDLGDVSKEDEVYLLLTGWILPTDTSLNIRIDQDPTLPSVEPPSVWVPNDSGDWELAIPAMGFPGGKTKTIVVDLSGHVRSNDPRIRIQTSAQIYWDAAQVVTNPPKSEMVITKLELTDALVDYHGFSNELPRNSTQPHRYDYQSVSKHPKWPPLKGGLTRFGDCASLLASWDDAMVVISGGDEIQLKFAVPKEPLPMGWKRDFVLHSVGWDKDADLNTLEGQGVDPLPFRSMQAYPPRGEDYLQELEVLEKNKWHRTREQQFRAFWQRGGEVASKAGSQ